MLKKARQCGTIDYAWKIILLVLNKTYLHGTPKNHHDEAILMGTNNIGSYEK